MARQLLESYGGNSRKEEEFHTIREGHRLLKRSKAQTVLCRDVACYAQAADEPANQQKPLFHAGCKHFNHPLKYVPLLLVDSEKFKAMT
jgi:hypothetical protein